MAAVCKDYRPVGLSPVPHRMDMDGSASLLSGGTPRDRIALWNKQTFTPSSLDMEMPCVSVSGSSPSSSLYSLNRVTSYATNGGLGRRRGPVCPTHTATVLS